jgi:hypothetical protein
MKSDASNNAFSIKFDGDLEETTDPYLLSNKFNQYFFNLPAIGKENKFHCAEFIFDNFKNLKRNNRLIIPTYLFSFKPSTSDSMAKLIGSLDTSSSAGYTEIPVCVMKHSIKFFSKHLSSLINYCLSSNQIPDDWKTAVVTPLYKHKGDKSNCNNYRGILVLPPFSKLFEKYVAGQILDYFIDNKLFYSKQHGFRPSHSCETALHEIITNCLNNMDNGLINLLLFIDFKKLSIWLNQIYYYSSYFILALIITQFN